jgi:hypothetical protein
MRAAPRVLAPAARLDLARALMDQFAVATGVTGEAPPRRYLWTDAFAVCNFLGLHRLGGGSRDLDLARALVDQVHHVLGRHRADDSRRGWISGLSEAEGARHPTAGGLRIGKELPERRSDEPFDPTLEWDRDGQYLHYLTQWMHALRRLSEETGSEDPLRWAVELARVAHARFTISDPGGRPQRMIWKASVDLSRALVPSMGQHDPLDAWLTCLELATATRRLGGPDSPVPLTSEVAAAAELAAHTSWETDDPLGIGALLVGIFRLARLAQHCDVAGSALLERLMAAARLSLDAWARNDPLAWPAARRLPFRELGLALGLHAVERIPDSPALAPLRPALAALRSHLPLAEWIDETWSDPDSRSGSTWVAHLDINAVMLATSLVPDGYLGPH